MENIYLVCFDFNMIRERFNPDDEFNSEIAVEFMEECHFLKEMLTGLFPNFIIPISNSSFLLKVNLKGNEILEMLIHELSNKVPGIKKGNCVEKQIYVAKLSDLNSYTFPGKENEIEYLKNSSNK